MKKIAIVLAALLLLGVLSGCKAEEKTPDYAIPGYDIHLYTGKGWIAAEETVYDLQLSKDGVILYAVGYTPRDFGEMPPMEELYDYCSSALLDDKSDVSTKEKRASYEVDGNKIVSTLFAAKDGDKEMEYYCFGFDFDDEAGSAAWLCFAADAKTMKSKKAELKKIADQTKATGVYVADDDLEQQLAEMMGEGETE